MVNLSFQKVFEKLEDLKNGVMLAPKFGPFHDDSIGEEDEYDLTVSGEREDDEDIADEKVMLALQLEKSHLHSKRSFPTKRKRNDPHTLSRLIYLTLSNAASRWLKSK
ncbi:unnamed protein product [Lactuca saligna]|uniref:Uncharacterized protein n=1 Tax=Lactuca saligna TaxID=75948 RepID=A0AA36EHU0_LACSI|nr:unnamed protein product [Lactuca saligna]